MQNHYRLITLFIILSQILLPELNVLAQGNNKLLTDKEKLSLDKRLDRDTLVIDLKSAAPAETLQPAEIHVNKNIAVPEESITGSTLIFKEGVIQRISLDQEIYQQGEVAQVHVNTVIPIGDASLNFLYVKYKLYPLASNRYGTMLAVPMNTDPGHYAMTLHYKEKGEAKKLELPFEVIPGSFSESDTAELDVCVLTEETLEMMRYEYNYFAKAYNRNPDSLMLDGDFIFPCAGSITGLYGTPRRYNEDLDKWSHKAIDIANAVGTKVYASNRGVVTLAKNLDVHGRSIVIAHGNGIHSIYLHLDSIKVKEGDVVNKGQLIGKLGKTGLCTGPNLHWGIMVNRIATNPQFWLKDKPELKEKIWVTPD
ncbi:hypothetical protein A2Y85_02410 [candidate division WOR-3 bacterium RBG_13_43_14]|uniref:M23ase beta-sheet core domain-containing protein n=1 Tax=candidate division WOR-3 bacterium RBG_13_43_14 TaxID=1802590 RepID=A0A1F4UCS7_UNCW3|nr:MAG: hypothetical protein A2Y85_02410 [candidate division WOR-3 bacterium RBG_13_43_14]